MKQKYLYGILLFFGLLTPVAMHAATSYSCDFENEADRDRWKLNPTANKAIYDALTNKWYIGKPGNNDGQSGDYGLYISDDEGKTAHYTNKGCWVMAYDIVSLDHLSTAGDYTLTFDYNGMGNVASAFDGIYVLWVPMTDPDTGEPTKIMSIATSTGTIPSTYSNYVIPLQPKIYIDYVGATFTWKQCVASIPNSQCDGQPHYLVFVWANGNQMAQQPGGKIDNIEIMDSRPCDPPTGLTLDIKGATSILSWSGTANEYEVTAYSYEEQRIVGYQVVQNTQAQFSNLPIGQTDFIVRAKCADDLYSLKQILSKLVYYPDQMCVDYLNLEKANCYISDDNNKPSSTISYNNFIKVKPADDGPSQMSSRHTVHFDKSEREPRTGGQAPTIPPGGDEFASVRLGNWDKNNQAERIEYSFDVDTMAYSVLLLKYLPIIEAPGHEPSENPRFKLDVLIGDTSLGACVQADFNANDVLINKSGDVKPDYAAQGWHKTPKSISQTSADCVWKEWTTVGVNLKKKEYAGKKLTVRLTTHDCTFSAHCGYAYFTLGCSDGKLKGMKCGTINPVFVAPDGFNYCWYLADAEKYRQQDGTIPEQYVRSHTQTFDAGMKNDTLYAVDCMFVQDSSCYFTLFASTLATNPVSIIGDKPIIKKSCREGKYSVQFDGSQSWVQEIDHVTGDTLTSRIYHIDRYEWKVAGLPAGWQNWSGEPKPIFHFPASGGDWTVRLTTSSGSCDSTVYYHLHLDELKETRDTTTVVLCDDVRKKGYKWSEKPDTTYYIYGLDSIKLYNETSSCDSILYLNLIEPVRVPVNTVVLPDNLPFEYRGRKYYKSTIDTIPSSNCDTTWILNMVVYENLKAEMKGTFALCGDTAKALPLEFKITQGYAKGYAYSFTNASLPTDTVDTLLLIGDHTLVIPLDSVPRPNYYEGALTLFDSVPRWNVTKPFVLTIHYIGTIVEQKWNDVLYVLSPKYNGGYEFSEIQWYRNDTLLEGETGPYLYQLLDVKGTTYYYVELTRADDGVKVTSCPMYPENRKPSSADPIIAEVPQTASAGAKVPVRLTQSAKLWLYSIGGQLYAAYSLPEGDSMITAPAQKGVYIVKILDQQGEVKAQRMLVQ